MSHEKREDAVERLSLSKDEFEQALKRAKESVQRWESTVSPKARGGLSVRENRRPGGSSDHK